MCTYIQLGKYITLTSLNDKTKPSGYCSDFVVMVIFILSLLHCCRYFRNSYEDGKKSRLLYFVMMYFNDLLGSNGFSFVLIHTT